MLEQYKPEIDIDLLNKFRSEHIPVVRESWHEYFIILAYLVSKRSLDAQSKFGAIFTDEQHNIISCGYNSFVRNIDDETLVNVRPGKYKFMIHAEHNGILNATRRGISLNRSSCYVTGKPCISCLQFMYQAGVKTIYYADIHRAVMCSGEKKEFDLILSLMSDSIQLIEVKSDYIFEKIKSFI